MDMRHFSFSLFISALSLVYACGSGASSGSTSAQDESCGGTETIAATAEALAPADGEDFDVFIEQFCKDDKRQHERMKFPIGFFYDEVTVTDPENPGPGVEYSDMASCYYKKTPMTATRHPVVKKKDVTAQAPPNGGYGYFVSVKKDGADKVMVMAGYVDSDKMYEIDFQKFDGKWFLTRYELFGY